MRGRQPAGVRAREGQCRGWRILAVAGRSKRRHLERRSAKAKKCLSLCRLREKLNNIIHKREGHQVEETQERKSRREGRMGSKSRIRHFKE